ncbi:hypothetical protein CY34DRAFT_16240 [Suillus luteus UH-Slu-Lm8-n1]|uniref:WW domain-containing protein n=1 Tax=Suillus luteus UH-Slu-Lm8-n1 TaxID=930992 RepID=A0A0C9ZGY2_9AGAM|nr:hypothetical protein CY34DRAFT_16240 [Suillus luteus UH-Slu-Lm8-n1]
MSIFACEGSKGLLQLQVCQQAILFPYCRTPHITISGPGGGSLTPQKSPPSPAPSTSATSVATASGACVTPNSNLNTSSSAVSVSSCTTPSSTTSTRKAQPIPPSDVNRYDRKRTVPRTKDHVFIKPGKKVFEDPPPSSRWEPIAHPEGALYYYDETRRIYTDADLSRPSTLSAIDAFADQVYNDARADPDVEITTKTELVVEDIDESTCGYYFVEQDTRCVFWLERFDAELLFENIRGVKNMGHISNMLLKLSTGEVQLSSDYLLSEILMFVDLTVTITSVTSVAPFEREELEKMLDLVMNIDGSFGEGTLDGKFTHTRCVVARFMSEFIKAKFFNFCGQPGARLDSDQTIYSKGRDHQSLLFIISSLLLFGAPRTNREDLKVIWVDRIINRVLWNQFIGKLNDEWTGLALSATVILNANVAFLAIPSVQDVARLLSYLSVASSIAVVLLVLLLVRQNQKKDCEGAVTLLSRVSQSFFDTEVLAITYSLPYGLLMWA